LVVRIVAIALVSHCGSTITRSPSLLSASKYTIEPTPCRKRVARRSCSSSAMLHLTASAVHSSQCSAGTRRTAGAGVAAAPPDDDDDDDDAAASAAAAAAAI
jgi:hypothetical protein